MRYLLITLSLLLSHQLFAQLENQIESDQPVSVEVDSVRKILVYPNPVGFTFLIEIDLEILTNHHLQFELFNVNGERVIFKEELTNPVELIERGHLAAGVYSYLIRTGSRIWSRGKLIFREF